MSVRNTLSTVKNFISNFWQQQQQQNQNQAPGLNEEETPTGSGSGTSRFQSLFKGRLFGTGSTDPNSNKGRKRPAYNQFEPEITDDEDDLDITLGSYPPFPKRLRTDPGPVPYPFGVGVPSAAANFQFFSQYQTAQPPPPLEMSSKNKPGPSTGSGRPPRRPAPMDPKPGPSSSAKSAKNVEVVTLDDDEDDDGSGSKAKYPPWAAKEKEKENDEKRGFGSGSGLASKEMEKQSRVGGLKTRLRSHMKSGSGSGSGSSPTKRDGNRISKCIRSIGNKFMQSVHSSAFQLKEKEKYKQLLKMYNVIETNGTFRTQALTKSRVDRTSLEAMYSRVGSSPSDALVSFRRTSGPGAASASALSPPLQASSPISRPTTATALLPVGVQPLLPRLFSSPDSEDLAHYSRRPFSRSGSGSGTPSASTSKSKLLAIQATPELVDLEAEPEPVSKPPTGRKSVTFLPSPIPTSPVKGAGAGNYSNLEEALNSSQVPLDLEEEPAEGTTPTPSTSKPLAITDGTPEAEEEDEDEDDPDISIIAENIVKKSRRRSLNTLKLEQTSCPYVESSWLTEKENEKARQDRIREELQTISVLQRESTLEKELNERIRQKLQLTEIIVLEEPPEVMPELTDEMLDIIEFAKRRGNDNEVLAKVALPKETITISRGDIKTLGPSQWLNDNIINTYIGLIVMRSRREDLKLPKVYAFQTFFYPKLLKEGYSNSLKRWTRKDDIFAHDLIILPIHLGMHWCLACVDLRAKSIRYFDSMGGGNQKCLNSLLDYLSKEMKERKQTELDRSEWKLEHAEGIPQQKKRVKKGRFFAII